MEDKKNTFYITTPIYYPSGKFHIGTAYTTVLADWMKKYKKQRGYDTFMLTGTDEHGQKIETIANQKGIKPQEYVDQKVEEYKKLWNLMDINYDKYIRTTDPKHVQTVQKIFDRFMEKGDIYKGEYEGLYCVPCETYFTETQLVDGKCPDCGREIKPMKEEAYFFNVKKYEKRLLEYYESHPDFIKPEYRRQEMINNFIKPGLEDLCVTRTTFNWGIPVLKDPKHVVYVWLDALTNYITALGYLQDDDSLFKKYWPADIHVIAKDIARFHLIYWPIFLMALDLPLPKTIFVHNFILMKDGKMSKSKGNVIYPETLVERYGLDATKYYLLREMPYGQDAIFTPEGFITRYNSDLCNDLGNLLNRTIGMVNKYFQGYVPAYEGPVNDIDKNLEEHVKQQINEYENNMETLHLANALESIWNIISRTNKYIDETEPWVLTKNGETTKLASVMTHLVENLRIIAILIQPLMSITSEKMLEQLGINEGNSKSYNSIYEYGKYLNNIKVIEKGEPLFLRLDVNEEIQFIKEKMK